VVAAVITGAGVMSQPELPVSSGESHFEDDGNVTDPELRASLIELVAALGRTTERLGRPEKAA